MAAVGSAGLGVYVSLSSPVFAAGGARGTSGECERKTGSHPQRSRHHGAVDCRQTAGTADRVLGGAGRRGFLRGVGDGSAPGAHSRSRLRPRRARVAGAGADQSDRLRRLATVIARRSSMQAMVSVGLVDGITRAVFVLFLTRTLQVQPPPIGPLLAARCWSGRRCRIRTARAPGTEPPRADRTRVPGALSSVASMAMTSRCQALAGRAHVSHVGPGSRVIVKTCGSVAMCGV